MAISINTYNINQTSSKNCYQCIDSCNCNLYEDSFITTIPTRRGKYFSRPSRYNSFVKMLIFILLLSENTNTTNKETIFTSPDYEIPFSANNIFSIFSSKSANYNVETSFSDGLYFNLNLFFKTKSYDIQTKYPSYKVSTNARVSVVLPIQETRNNVKFVKQQHEFQFCS